jgi:predicted ribosome quality control (RQC) complex YloA/Tae2 family protein
MNTVHVKAEVTQVRKRFWFEKFVWFVSSDGVVVVAGRDAQQNEMLVRRYLRAYVGTCLACICAS